MKKLLVAALLIASTAAVHAEADAEEVTADVRSVEMPETLEQTRSVEVADTTEATEDVRSIEMPDAAEGAENGE